MTVWEILIHSGLIIGHFSSQGPGLFFVMPCIDSFSPVDMRTVSFDVPPQEVKPIVTNCQLQVPHEPAFQILSRDSVTVTVDAVVNFNVYDAALALCSVDDFR